MEKQAKIQKHPKRRTMKSNASYGPNSRNKKRNRQKDREQPPEEHEEQSSHQEIVAKSLAGKPIVNEDEQKKVVNNPMSGISPIEAEDQS